MIIYDISQELFHCSVYPGDISPTRNVVASIEKGNICNVTELTMCAHNGTHMDAPFHFIKNGKTVDQVPLEKLIGFCCVVSAEGAVTATDARRFVDTAKSQNSEAAKRILIKGDAFVTLEAAKVFADEVWLVGNESQTVGPIHAPAAVHYELLGSEVVLLEGVRLAHVPDGIYFLNAAPINLGGSDGAPCRAVLIADV